ncbi:hypothetical protein [Marininema halotolerans]|uniref:Carbohydrate binding domain-containing protein n=1 Tax=Marininema halotolerans TaxID=1155944 RepID=A0A1I6PS93_9BACL|nr:hypothetical protein [Marininema halotolerans]SFS43107.1 hypothetical protein SAMN05444972_102102 [Marininema halotolerans]
MSKNRVKDNGFENQTLGQPVSAPWSSTNTTLVISAGSQLEGNFAALLSSGAAISQTLKPMRAGRSYTFTAGFSTLSGNTGTIDVRVGNVLRRYQASSIAGALGQYATYTFRFNAPQNEPAVLSITNNAAEDIKIDTVFILRG